MPWLLGEVVEGGPIVTVLGGPAGVFAGGPVVTVRGRARGVIAGAGGERDCWSDAEREHGGEHRELG